MSPARLPDKFYIDLAIGVAPFDDICRTYGLDPEAVAEVEDDAEFQQRVLMAKQSVEDDGQAFRARCRTEVHETMPYMSLIVKDPEVPASTRVDAWRTLVKFSGMEPKEQTQGATGPSLSLTIIAPGGEKQVIGQVIDQPAIAHTPDPGHTIDMADLGW